MSARFLGPRKSPTISDVPLDMHGRENAPVLRDLPSHEEIIEPGPDVLMAHSPHDVHCETVRALRTELMLRRESSPDRSDVIVLLSPCGGEGRSLLAAELAVAFAQSGRATLLVDADMRYPRQHELFPVDNSEGLAQAIESGASPRLYGVKHVPRLSVLTSGHVTRNPLELLSSQRFAALVEEWRQSYAFVVIDTPPVGEFSDGLAIANVVGRVLTLSRARRTPFKRMQEMLRRLAATRAQVLGAVINHF